eukprot:9467777-Pyramimonas_sp.AAC.2
MMCRSATSSQSLHDHRRQISITFATLHGVGNARHSKRSYLSIDGECASPERAAKGVRVTNPTVRSTALR